MIIHDWSAIFIHIPEMAGNFLSRQLFLPRPRDILTTGTHQDGVERASRGS